MVGIDISERFIALASDGAPAGATFVRGDARAREWEAECDAAFHRYHEFELVVGALQIAIVLASVSVVTRVTPLAFGAGVIGCIAAIYGVLVAQGVI